MAFQGSLTLGPPDVPPSTPALLPFLFQDRLQVIYWWRGGIFQGKDVEHFYASGDCRVNHVSVHLVRRVIVKHIQKMGAVIKIKKHHRKIQSLAALGCGKTHNCENERP